MKKNLLAILVISGLFLGCSTKELEDKIEQLETENAILKTQLDGCLHGAEKLLGQIKVAFADEKFLLVRSTFATLQERHPESSEFAEAKVIYEKTLSITAERQRQETLERERISREIREKAEREEAERLRALNRLKKRHDDISGNTWYYNPYFTHNNNSNRISVYIGNRGGTTWLRLKMSYAGSNWIFFERAFLSYEGNTLEIPFDRYRDKKTENSGRGVWEWIDVSVTSGVEAFLYKLANSTDAKMRFSGKYTRDRNLTQDERKGILDILVGVDVLRKKPQ